MRKTHEAKIAGAREVTIWGRGTARREFMHVDDLADALVHLLKYYEDEQHINVGVGYEVAIHDLARIVADTVGFKGHFVHDLSKPEGAPSKLMDVSRLSALGWRPRTGLADGLRATYAWYLAQMAESV